jgi:hypothetical protein
LEGADLTTEAQQLGWTVRYTWPHIIIFHAGGEQLRDRKRQVMLRARSNMTSILVRRDSVGQKTITNYGFCNIEIERAHTMTNVEQDTTFASLPYAIQYMPILLDSVAKAMEAISDHIAGSELTKKFVEREVGRVACPNKQGEACIFTDLDSALQDFTRV